jgi:FAD/FMN-containing dehydrogenase
MWLKSSSASTLHAIQICGWSSKTPVTTTSSSLAELVRSVSGRTISRTSRSQGVKEFHNDDYSGPAFKAGAGVQGFEILEAARGKNVTVLAGICETVGWAGGYLAGGGHSPVASIYDMAADQVLAYVAITADGRFVTASSTTNADLFWALRGGGGSTFGVITSVIVKAHPRIKVTKSVFSFQAAPNNTVSFWKAVNAYFKSFPTFTNAGTYSYFWSESHSARSRIKLT